MVVKINQKGISNIELIPVLLVFALLINFSLGFFGVIHSGILNSIAARNYAFETFRHRQNLNRLRDKPSGSQDVVKIAYNKVGYRFHGIISEGSPSHEEPQYFVTQRPIKFTDANQGFDDSTKPQDHRRVTDIKDPGLASDVYTESNSDIGNTVWLRTTYGICLNARCMPIR